jgi:hypothetical protein
MRTRILSFFAAFAVFFVISEGVFSLNADTLADSILFRIASNEGSLQFHIKRSGNMPVGTDHLTGVNPDLALVIFPNPFFSSINLSPELDQPAKTDIIITDQAGKIMQKFSIDGIIGKTQMTWDSFSCAPGAYFCRVSSGNWESSRKIVKW